jgi:hypothetical protein
VGNPKSLLRLVELGRLKMSSLSLLVIDEVDACLLSIDMKKVRKQKSKIANLSFLIKISLMQKVHRLLSRHLSGTFREEEGNVLFCFRSGF